MKRIILSLSLFLFLCIAQNSFSQSDKEKSAKLVEKAITLMDNGKIDESIQLLEEAKELDPDNPGIDYEIAMANYLKKDYPKAINVLVNIKNKEPLEDIYYQILGNSYDLYKQPDKAKQTYEEGLKKYPNAGRLYLELGVIHTDPKNMNKALDYFEKGIEVDPDYSSNYYWASRIFCNSQNEVWGLIYGEIFMNLERGSKRTQEISKLLYDTYKQGITILSDTSAEVSFASNNLDIDFLKAKDKPMLPFGLAIYEPTILLALIPITPIDLNSLSRIRESFIKLYYENGYSTEYPINIFDYQNKILQAGHFDAYNHWFLMKGSETEFDDWIKENESKFDDFIEWFKKNPIEITELNKTYRNQY